MCRRSDAGGVAVLLLPDGDSPRLARFVGLEVAVAEGLSNGLLDGLAETVAAGDALTGGEAAAVAIGEAVAEVAPAALVV